MKHPDKQNTEIEILAKKLMENTISQEELAQLENWYAQTPEERTVWNLQKESKTQLMDRLFREITQKKSTSPATGLLSWWKIAAAASVAIIATIGILSSRQQRTDPIVQKKVENLANGKVTKIHLPDHSIVWLKGNSRLEFPSKFSDTTREVTLYGEALFEVSKDKKHPFLIRTGSYVARVLGTSFYIKENHEAKTFKLTVLTGKVAITAKALAGKPSPATVLVIPGQEYQVLNVTQLPRIITTPITEKPQILHGTQYDMNFENATFSEVSRRIEQKFNVKISTGDEKYTNCSVSADVTDQSLENTLKVISSVLNSRYALKQDKITLQGGGCD
ncbi:FecR family protein [Pedobacter sp. AW31-3R]|uniref:FecR family protein n=1 Tax=Pedobacter sp. AW31-3R TaxID=3445781 RepID=UPI003FA0B756